VILILITLFLGSILVIVVTQRTYKPIQNLLQTFIPSNDYDSNPSQTLIMPQNEISKIQSSLEKLYQENIRIRKSLSESKPVLLDYFIANVIKGRFFSISELNNACRILGITFTHNYFCVCIVVADDNELQNTCISELDMCRNLQFLLPSDINGYFCCGNLEYVREKCFLGVLCFEYETSMSIHNTLINLKNEFLKQYGLILTISFGEKYEDLSMLPKSYISARFALKYRFFEGSNTVIPPPQMSSAANIGLAYPYQEVLCYKETLSQWKINDIRTAIFRIIERMRKLGTTLLLAECVCLDIINIFIKQAKGINNKDAVKIGQYFDLFFITEFSSISEIDSITRLLADKIAEFIEKHVHTTHSTSGQEYISYLNENIGNYQFSVAKMAKDFYISPQYLRKSFKKEVGSSLLDYFTDIKIEKAKQLLTNSNITIADIVVALGYVDISNFIHKFKIKVGLTPGQYREKYTNAALE